MVLPSLVIQVKRSDQAMIKVELRGELDALTAGSCAEFLLALLDRPGRSYYSECSERTDRSDRADRPVPDVVLDLSLLTFCDAGGLSTFVRLANRAEAAGGRVTLTGVRPMLARQLRVTGLNRRFPVRGPTDGGKTDPRRLAADP